MEIVITNGIFYILLFLIIISFRKNKGEPQEELGREASEEMKGLAILMVLLGHMTFMAGLMTMPIAPYLGAQGVELFLFLSGFGLVASYQKKGLQKFISKRLRTIYLPYTVVNVLKIIVYAFMGMIGTYIGIKMIFFNFIGLDINMDTSMWYIQYILICYVIFFLIFSIKKLSLRGKVGILWVVFILMGGILIYKGKIGVNEYHPFLECNSHHLSFPLGALACLLYELRKKVPTFVFPVVSGISFVVYYVVSANSEGALPELLPYYIVNTAFIFFIAALFVFLKRLQLQSKLLQKLGGLAFHIYLNEMVVLSTLFGLPIDNWIKILCILGISLVTAVATKWFSDFLEKLWERGKTQKTL